LDFILDGYSAVAAIGKFPSGYSTSIPLMFTLYLKVAGLNVYIILRNFHMEWLICLLVYFLMASLINVFRL
jgi:hypothetical protein